MRADGSTDYVLSQFHYGSIKTISLPEMNQKLIESQFHYGSIKTKVEFIPTKEISESQFHYGSIKTVIRIDTGRDFRRVSIPLWFD